MTPHLQLGAQLDATWRARLSEHLGSFTVEPRKGRAADVMQDRFALAGLNAVCALLCFTLPEREAHPSLYARSIALLDGLGASHWAEAYINWELALLEELGFGLDLSLGFRGGIGLLLGLAPELELLGVEIGAQFRRLLAVAQAHLVHKLLTDQRAVHTRPAPRPGAASQPRLALVERAAGARRVG